MSRSSRAATLISILTDHVAAQDKWEDYHRSAVKNGENKRERAALLEGYTVPLLALCKREGFAYADILKIIPAAFKTRREDRATILDDLIEHVHVTYAGNGSI